MPKDEDCVRNAYHKALYTFHGIILKKSVTKLYHLFHNTKRLNLETLAYQAIINFYLLTY